MSHPLPRPDRRMVLAGLTTLAGGFSLAAVRAPTLSAADEADLKRIESYLDGIHTLQARFTQTNPDGSIAGGQVWLSRPGRMRFEYDPPTRMMIVSNGDYVAVDDRELNNVSFYPVDATPAWFLLREGIRLTGDVTVTRFERGPRSFRLTAVANRDAGSGAIALTLEDQPLSLRQWSVIDQQGRATTVALTDERFGGVVAADLFKLPERTPLTHQ